MTTSADDKAWDEPGVEQVLDGVFRIPLPLPNDGLRAVNVYAISDGDGLVLIDAGWALEESQRQLERSLDEIEFKIGDIREFLVTHMHRDHYDGALAMRALLGTGVRIGLGEKPSIEDGYGNSSMRERIRRTGAAELIAQEPPDRDLKHTGIFKIEPPDSYLTPGVLSLHSRELEVVETPGHTQGHVVFHDHAAVALFAGDHVLPRITPSIGLEPKAGSLPLQNYLDSLRLMLARPDARLLPAHGPVRDSTHARVNELLAQHETRLEQTFEIARGGPVSSFAVAAELPWTRRKRKLAELDPMNQLLAVGETAAHLEVLVVRGLLTRFTSSEGVDCYTLAQAAG
jgi:glyoxylase-like metal-dependent hydrolase (beta-lactamase superfamily II)